MGIRVIKSRPRKLVNLNHINYSRLYSYLILNFDWFPFLCYFPEICKPLKPVNMHLTCHGSRFEIVNCSGNLFEGTSVIPRCHSPYHPQTTVEYSKIICLPNGEWSDVLYKCIPGNLHFSYLIFIGTWRNLYLVYFTISSTYRQYLGILNRAPEYWYITFKNLHLKST